MYVVHNPPNDVHISMDLGEGSSYIVYDSWLNASSNAIDHEKHHFGPKALDIIPQYYEGLDTYLQCIILPIGVNEAREGSLNARGITVFMHVCGAQ